MRSPYVVLGVATHASRAEIRTRFRELVKVHHPDLNPNNKEQAQKRTAELIDAHDSLLDDDLAGRAGSSQVARDCEVFSLDELRADALHDVFGVTVHLEEHCRADVTADACASDGAVTRALPLATAMRPVIVTSRDDSVSDVKRALQARFGSEWGLAGRRRDRDGVALGWELVHVRHAADGVRGDEDTDGAVLSYHLFLHNYGVEHDDVFHAVVRR